jgi:hypothetical protein
MGSPHFPAIEKVGQSIPIEEFRNSALFLGGNLETDERSEGNPRIMMRAAGEVNFIASLKA